MDKSETHVRVSKNGIEDWVSKRVIEKLHGGINAVKKEGWEILPVEPIEVQELRSKKAEAIVESPEGSTIPIESIPVEQVKRKYTKRES